MTEDTLRGSLGLAAWCWFIWAARCVPRVAHAGAGEPALQHRFSSGEDAAGAARILDLAQYQAKYRGLPADEYVSLVAVDRLPPELAKTLGTAWKISRVSWVN